MQAHLSYSYVHSLSSFFTLSVTEMYMYMYMSKGGCMVEWVILTRYLLYNIRVLGFCHVKPEDLYASSSLDSFNFMAALKLSPAVS